MPYPNFATAPFGPFTQGVIDSANPSAEMAGTLKRANHWVYSGKDRFSVRPGLVTQMTLLDDAGTPAPVTSVLLIQPFADGAIAIAHSTVTSKVYLYKLNATLTGWYEKTAGALQSNTSPQPIGVVWSAMAAAPDVLAAEGLGFLYIANTQASSPTAHNWPSKQWDGTFPVTLATMLANGTYVNGVLTAGTDIPYYLGVVSFKKHLWAWGYGSGSVDGFTLYRPELIAFTTPNFGIQVSADNFTIGDRVRSLRERIVGAAVAAESLYVGGTERIHRFTGDGRDTWTNVPVDSSYGFVGPKCMVTVGEHLYYWSPRGPMRVSGLYGAFGIPPRPEPLWDQVYAAIQTVQNDAKIVAFFDPDHDTVGWLYDVGSGPRLMATYDLRRGRYTGTDADLGVVMYCSGNVRPIFSSTSQAALGPQGPPVPPCSTTNVSASGATYNWVAGDPNAQTEVSIALSGQSYAVVAVLPAGVSSYQAGSQTLNTAYTWRVRHLLNGGASTYLQNQPGQAYLTASTLPAPTGLTAVRNFFVTGPLRGVWGVTLTWMNTDSAASIKIFDSANGLSFVQAGTQTAGNASQNILFGAQPGSVFQFWEVKHTVAGFPDSPASNIAAAY